MAFVGEVADLYVILRAVTEPFKKAMGEAGATGEATTSKIGGSVGKLTKVMIGVGTATMLTAAMSVKWANDFQTQYTRLFTAAGAAKDQVLANRQAMLDLGSATGYTGTQIAEAMYHPISAGYDMAHALQIVKYSAQEARISGASLDDTTYSLSSVMKSFSKSNLDAGQTMSLLNAIVGEGDMHFQDFNASIKSWAPTASAMGISIQTMGSALGYLTDRGASAEEAATRLTMGLTMMATPSAQAAKLLKGLGVASGDVKASSALMTETLKKANITQNQLALDLQKPDGIYVALTHVKTALEQAGVSGTEADSTLSKIFGGGRSDKAILALMQDLDGLKTKYDKVGQDASGKNFQQAWEEAQKTSAVAFDKLKASLINLGIAFGEKLMPYVSKAMNLISAGTQWVLKHKEVLIVLAGVITGTVVVALYSMASALYATAAAAEFNPVIAALTALALVAVEIVAHWNAVKHFFEDMWNWVMAHKAIFAVVLAPLLAIIGPIILAIKLIISHWQQIWDFMVRLGKDFLQWGKDIAGFFIHVWDALVSMWRTDWATAVAVVKAIWDGLTSAWQSTATFFTKIWNATGGKLVHEIAKDWDAATKAIVKEWDRIVADLQSIWSSLVTIWNATGGKLVHYISDALDWIAGEVDGVFGQIVKMIGSYLKFVEEMTAAALRVVMSAVRIAWSIIWGLTKVVWGAITTVIKVAWDLIGGIVRFALHYIGGIMAALWDYIKGIVQVAWDIITGIINTALDLIKNVLKLFADLFTGKWSKLWTDLKKIVSDLWNDIWSMLKNTVTDVVKTLYNIGHDIIMGLIHGIEDMIKAVVQAAKDLWNGIWNFFKGIGSWLYQAGKDLIQGLINGIGDMISSATDAVSNLAGSIWDSAKHGFGLWSPSHIAHEHGQMIVQGLINGINSMSGKAASTMTDLTKSVNGELPISGSMNPISGGVTNRGAAAPGTINIIVQGSVLTDRDLRDVVQTQMLQLGARYSTSYTPYKR